MTFAFGLGAGLKALSAARMGLQTAGHNVANVNTPGYSRQRILQSAAFPFMTGTGFQIGAGVEVDDIQRLVDEGIERRLRLQTSLQARASLELARWQEIEGMFNEPDAGLSKRLSGLFGRIDKLRTDPGDRSLRGGVVQAARGLADDFNLLASRLTDLQESTFAEVRSLVRDLNAKAARVAELNAEIVAIESQRAQANDLRDARERIVKEIAELADVRAIPRGGAIDLVVGGRLVVSGARSAELSARLDEDGTTSVVTGRDGDELTVSQGKIGGLLAQQSRTAAGLREQLDQLARNLALEMNRIHTTGVPRGGPFQELKSFYGGTDSNGDGNFGNELFSQSGLPFDVVKGDLWVTVTDRASGDIERTRIAIDPDAMTIESLAAKLSEIDNLSATVDPNGRLRITATAGHGFDFSNKLDPAPDTFGSFGGAAPSIASNAKGPFDLSSALSSGSASFTVTVDGTARTVSLTTADFKNVSSVTAEELAAAINADVGAWTTAAAVGDRLVIRSDSTGKLATLSLTDGPGSPLAAIGMPVGSTRNGQDAAVEVKVFGKYEGKENGELVFVAEKDGQIGVTEGLTIGVYDHNGSKLASLDVGRGSYSPGDKIEVTDGIEVSFGPGSVSATHNDVFSVETLADSDTSDVLVALGLNSFFHGNDAASLQVNEDLEKNHDLLAAGSSGAAGDSDNLSRMMDLRQAKISGLEDRSFEDYYGGLVGEIGFETASAKATLQARDRLFTHLKAQRQQVSGVNIDEEMVDMVRYQQAFEAASRFINVVNELSRTLLDLAR